jgi:hypothetical protein
MVSPRTLVRDEQIRCADLISTDLLDDRWEAVTCDVGGLIPGLLYFLGLSDGAQHCSRRTE